MLKSFILTTAVLTLTGSLPSGYAEENPIATDAKETSPLQAGVDVPEVSFTAATGDEITLASLHEKGPVVLVTITLK